MTIPQYEFMIQLFTMARMGAGQKLVPPEFEMFNTTIKKKRLGLMLTKKFMPLTKLLAVCRFGYLDGSR
jgi:hypothetical protein